MRTLQEEDVFVETRPRREQWSYDGAFDWRRYLAAAPEDGSDKLDYTILSVVVATLGLILVVELVRHRIDVKAMGRPFFQTVLNGVYRELATLGIVEFVIFLLHKYYEDLNIAQEMVFADVHFTLFYTALFNAIQSAILAVFSIRISNRLWVRTEELDLDHYVEIREEFERVHALLYGEGHSERTSSVGEESSHRLRSKKPRSNRDLWQDASSNFKQPLSTKTLVAGIWKILRYPHLCKRHNELLIQVRFHELRVHFLQANDLPLKLKVSDYLMRSELSVLKKLVHITTFAWLLLLGGVNLIYFLMGIVVYVTGDVSRTGDALTGIFLAIMVLFLLVSLIIYHKMKQIFGQIMHMKLIAHNPTGEEVTIRTALMDSEREIPSQLALFWWNDPTYVISLIQFMQFGYAIGLAVLLVFWEDIDVPSAPISAAGFLGVVFGCYICFVAIMAHIIPRYTVCTSLGQLVNYRRLHETVARFRLEEAQRVRLQQMEEETVDDSVWEDFDSDDEDGCPSEGLQRGPLLMAKKALSERVLSVPLQNFQKPSTAMNQPQRSKTFEDAQFGHRESKADIMAELVTGDTDSLRDKLPADAKANLSDREQRMRERRANRKKTMSEGVLSMRNLATDRLAPLPLGPAGKSGRDLFATEPTDTEKSEDIRAARRQRRRSVSASASIQQMREMGKRGGPVSSLLGPVTESKQSMQGHPSQPSAINNSNLLAELVMTDTKELRTSLRDEALPERRRRPRHKSKSEGVGAMRHKSISDGVGAMRKMVGLSGAAANVLEAAEISDDVDALGASKPRPRLERKRSSRHSRRKSLSDSADLALMRLQQDEEEIKGKSIEVTPIPSWHATPRPSKLSASALKSLPSLDEKKVRINPEISEDMASNLSDDGHSDVDDVPEYDPSVKVQQTAEPEPLPTVSDIALAYFRSRRYHLVSAVFGTGVCFFCVGMRVETLLLATGILPDTENTIHANLATLFWIEVAWLCCFVIGSSWLLYLSRPRADCDQKTYRLFLASILDIFLCGVCLACLMVAESKRCCDDKEEGDRLLAAEPAKDESEYGYEEVDCCPNFGSRSYGGLGNIEPFTSLIALRLLRFFVAKKTVGFFAPRLGWAPGKENDRLTDHPEHPEFGNKHAHDDDHEAKTMQDETGNIVELWKHALGKYPDIVQQYGEFSGELLQAMLGVEITVADALDAHKLEQDEPPGPPEAEEANNDTKPIRESTVVSPNTPKTPRHRKTLSVDDKYASLSAEAKCVILAGKLGKPVRSTSEDSLVQPASPRARTVASLPPLHESPLISALTASIENVHSSAPSLIAPKFEIGTESPDVSTDFFAPSSRLLRSMRRCDRRLPPLLNSWAVVDVVMTKHEIVYFDASDVDILQNSGRTEEEIRSMEGVRQAITATKGGKGLRLRDVAVGRKVVGHVLLSHIESIHVERINPVANSDSLGELDASQPVTEVNDEFWRSSDAAARPSRTARWSRTKEDRLKINSQHGTLYLRFYGDLEDSENNSDRCSNEREDEGPIFKNNCLQWCQTVVRLCGAGQLKQKLLHYGDDNSDELRDYIVVVDAEEAEHGQRMMKKLRLQIHRRRISSTNLVGLATEAADALAGSIYSGKASSYRGSVSVDEGATAVNGDSKPKKSRSLRKSKYGEHDTNGADNV